MAWKYLQYDGETGKKRTVSGGGGGGASALTDLDDVNVSSPSDGQILKYDNASSKWVNSNSGEHTYSTNEQVVGTWIDGKPVYEKVVTLNKTIQGNTWVQLPELNSLNIDKCIDWKFYSDANTIVGGQYDWNATPNEIWLYRNVSLSMKAIYIRYTKTTD